MHRRTPTLLAVLALSTAAMPAGALGDMTISNPGDAIPDDTPAGVSLPTFVADDFTVTGVAVTLTWPGTATFGNTTRDGHTWIGDLVATLTYDDGVNPTRTAVLFNRIGKTSPVSGHGYSADFTGTYTFADGGADLWAAAAIATALPSSVPQAVYQPSDNLFNFAASTSAPISLNDTFAGVSSRGTWRLNIADMAGGEVGRLDNWSLTLIPAPGPVALATLGAITLLSRRRR